MLIAVNRLKSRFVKLYFYFKSATYYLQTVE